MYSPEYRPWAVIRIRSDWAKTAISELPPMGGISESPGSPPSSQVFLYPNNRPWAVYRKVMPNYRPWAVIWGGGGAVLRKDLVMGNDVDPKHTVKPR